jgi:hypothetical protein
VHLVHRGRKGQSRLSPCSYQRSYHRAGGSAHSRYRSAVDSKINNTANNPIMCAQLSRDGGTTWTAAQGTATLTTSTAAYTLGGTANNWARTWAVGDFASPAFRVRIIDVAGSTASYFLPRCPAVRVSYQ